MCHGKERYASCRTLLILVTMLALLPAHALAGNWPGWRGPTGLGYTDEKDLPLTWDGKTGKNILWKVLAARRLATTRKCHSPGWSCPIVWRDRVFITTAVWPAGPVAGGAQEHHRRASRPLFPGQRRQAALGHRRSAGQVSWSTTVYHGYAVPTPVTDGKHVFALFGSGVLGRPRFRRQDRLARRAAAPAAISMAACAAVRSCYEDSVIVPGIGNPGCAPSTRKPAS